jgi:Family of unknown function (DUF6182)
MDADMLLADLFESGLDGRSATKASDLYAVVVVRDLDPVAFVGGTLEFARGIPTQRRDPWYRTFTRTLFFAGNPLSVATRFQFSHLAPGGEIGWLGPADRPAFLWLSRMLRLFRAPAAAAFPAKLELTVPGGPPTGRLAELRVATAGVATQEYLVHVNHTLCEASLRGLLAPGDALSLSHVDELDPAEAESRDGDIAQLRIGEDTRRAGQLRLYAVLTGGLRAA